MHTGTYSQLGRKTYRCRYCKDTGLMQVWRKSDWSQWCFRCNCEEGDKMESIRRLNPTDEKGNKVMEIIPWEEKEHRKGHIPVAEQRFPLTAQ